MKSPTEREMRALEAPAYLQAGISTPAQLALAEEMSPAGTILLLCQAEPQSSSLAPSASEATDSSIRGEETNSGAEQVSLFGRSPTETPEVAIAWKQATIRLSNACERLTRSIEILMGASGITLIPAVRRFVEDGVVFLNEAGNCGVDRRACGSNRACSVSSGGGSSNDALPSR